MAFNSFTQKICLFCVVCVCFISPTAYSITTSHTDGTFNNADWANEVIIDTAGGDDSVAGQGQDLTGGNPGAYFYGGTTWGAAGHVNEGHFYSPGIIDLSTSGSISSINFGVDANVLAVGGGATQLNLGIVLIQSNSYFISSSKTVTYGSGWTSPSWSLLNSANFTLVKGSGTLDLSSSGAPISIGYYTSGSVSGAASQQWGVDNFYVTITFVDTDDDGVTDHLDNCPNDANATQQDTDSDGVGDFCDLDDDNDGVSDGADINPINPLMCGDVDGDTCDDCSSGIDGFGPLSDVDVANDGLDTDSDGLCDAGDSDDDGDSISDFSDNCPITSNVDQRDNDGDTLGDVCDSDDDNDGLSDIVEIKLATDPLVVTDQNQVLVDTIEIDTDGDGLSNSYEVNISGTDPNVADMIYTEGTLPDPGDMDGDGDVDLGDNVLHTKQILEP